MRNQVGIHRKPDVDAREIRFVQKMGDRVSPIAYQVSYEAATWFPDFLRRRKTARIKLEEPYDVLTIHRQNAYGDPAACSMEFVEIFCGPVHRFRTTNQTDDL